MATPMTPDQWRHQLHKFDVPFREIAGWDSPNSGRDDETGKVFGPVHGVVIHHTGDDAPDAADRGVIINGRAGLPGPLAQSGGNDDGVTDMITCHRANHAGGGDPDVLRAVINESYGDYPPATHEHEGSAGAVDGNDCFYGRENYYSGGHPMTAVQYRTSVAWSAAICDFHGWSAKSVIGHKEWSDWKIDPGHVDMKVYRADVQKMLDAQHGNPPLVGPAFLTPAITKAIAANVAYDQALDAVTLATAQRAVDAARAEVKAQRVALRGLEQA